MEIFQLPNLDNYTNTCTCTTHCDSICPSYIQSYVPGILANLTHSSSCNDYGSKAPG